MKPYPAGQWCNSVLRYSVRPFAVACIALPLAAQGAPVALASVVLQISCARSTDPESSGLQVNDVVLDFLANLRTNTNDPGQTATAPAPGGAGSADLKL